MSAELEKTGEVTEVLDALAHTSDACARGMCTFIPTLYNHLGKQTLLLLKILTSFLPGLKLSEPHYSTLVYVMLSVPDVWEVDLVAIVFH